MTHEVTPLKGDLILWRVTKSVPEPYVVRGDYSFPVTLREGDLFRVTEDGSSSNSVFRLVIIIDHYHGVRHGLKDLSFPNIIYLISERKLIRYTFEFVSENRS
jgi:hypothetical protein